ncbi:UNVERIFIED_CONTAM: LuxR C-terminal-related transcriptional regulator [Methylobacteriaceae bacterium AG10]|jgi:DNA-binding CsgD family transcriptional regulator|nr:LuxR C-terminal-related transcriptional regulator [Methylobacteriaceae bacterium AG10]
MRTNRPKLTNFGSQEWFQRVGNISRALGEINFHENLIDLFGCLIDHSARWIIRFSDPAPPEIMYTSGVPQSLRDHYNRLCSDVDPFAAHWRRYKEVGVRALSQFKSTADTIDAGSYNFVFKPVANVSDELGLFLPTIGNSSIGLFLERERGDFRKIEIERAEAAFPIIDGLERAHIGRIFDATSQGGFISEAAQLNPQPTLVQDRCGVELFSSRSWRDAAESDPSLLAVAVQNEQNGPIMLDDFIVNIERFDKYFPLAPSGRMLTLTPCPDDPQERASTRERTELIRRLTRRERDIFNLIVGGRSSSDISRLLSMSKGTVKNYAIRICRKANVKSRLGLIHKYTNRSFLERGIPS